MGTTHDSFTPRRRATVAVSATTATQAFQLTADASPVSDQVRIVGGTADCRIEFGTSTVVATAPVAGATPTPGSLLIKAGSIEVVTVPPLTTHVACLAAAAATLEFTLGTGL